MTNQFNRTYLVLTLLILITEILIAIYIKTGFVRHTLGDVLATILVFSFFRSFLKVNPIKLGIYVLIFAFTLELIQFLNVLDYFNVQNKIVRIALGTTFQATDLIAYTLGVVIIVITDIKLFSNE
ncbi:DUF2809 domain-containing protein [Seonamhaeicola sp. ML3]|uniref:ribosomal maturation YjgA family protein n=1 Tax=Seonamhaeicola sp. ML3 TaxID=2937786 RepID=UPI00200C1376|nr:DUF2809 domain-containing protein [Seonamhaeicola sp. ML3]